MDSFFQKNLYTVVDELIDNDYIKWAVKYFDLKFNIFRDYSTKRHDPPYSHEVVFPFNRCYYNDPLVQTLLISLTPKLEQIVDKKLYPTYSFCRGYEAGQNLEAHTDRAACEYSITLPLCGPIWPIYFEGVNDGIMLTPGQGLIYKGQELVHYRHELDAGMIVQLHLHYVDKDGKNERFKFDKKEVWLEYAKSAPFFTMSSRSEHISFS